MGANGIERRLPSATDAETVIFLYGQGERIDWRCHTFRRLAMRKTGGAYRGRGGWSQSENPEIDCQNCIHFRINCRFTTLMARPCLQKASHRKGVGTGLVKVVIPDMQFNTTKTLLNMVSNNAYDADVLGYHILCYFHTFMQQTFGLNAESQVN